MLFGRFHKNLEVSRYSINALKAPQMVTLGKISCCGGLWVLLALVGWSIKKNSRGQNTVYPKNFEAKAHDLVTSNGRYVVVGRCWVLLALVGCSLLKPPQPTSATTRLLGVGLLHPGHGRPPISSSGWTSWTTRWTTWCWLPISSLWQLSLKVDVDEKKVDCLMGKVVFWVEASYLSTLE